MSYHSSEASVPVLYIDDDPNDHFLIQEAARQAKTRLRFCCLGGYDQAIAYLGGTDFFTDREEHPWPMLVLLDGSLHGHNGADILRWIRAQPQS